MIDVDEELVLPPALMGARVMDAHEGAPHPVRHEGNRSRVADEAFGRQNGAGGPLHSRPRAVSTSWAAYAGPCEAACVASGCSWCTGMRSPHPRGSAAASS